VLTTIAVVLAVGSIAGQSRLVPRYEDARFWIAFLAFACGWVLSGPIAIAALIAAKASWRGVRRKWWLIVAICLNGLVVGANCLWWGIIAIAVIQDR